MLGGITITSNSSSPTKAPTVPQLRREEVSSNRDEVRESTGPAAPHHLEFGGSEGILATDDPVKHVRPVGADFAVDGTVEEERPFAFIDASGASA